MIAIPDTGPGLSGFLAHYLWQAYIHFPSSGKWDWLLLFLLLAAVTHLTFLGYFWEGTKADMAALREKKADYSSRIGIWPIFFCGVSLAFLTWFFDTPAGLTFLTERQLFGEMLITEASDKLSFFAVVIPIFASEFLGIFIMTSVNEREEATGLKGTHPFPTRDFINLCAGGGVFQDETVGEFMKQHPARGYFFFMLAPIWYLLMFLVGIAVHQRPYSGREDRIAGAGPIAALILLECFLFAAIITAMFRMLFVYILHKRTFG